MNRPDHPGAEVPSAEVLDELLRAFSVDVTDGPAHDHVDLASPEVDELLTPPGEPVVPIRAEDGVADSPADSPTDPPPDERRDEMPDEPPDDAQLSPDVATDPDPAPPQEVEGSGAEDDHPSAPTTVVIDAADDPPDAVYLAAGDPLLVARASSTTVSSTGSTPAPGDTTIFIDDRHTGETISLEAATAATRIEPRMRERRIAVRRSAGRKRLGWALLVGIVIAVVVAVLALLGSSLFAIDDVDVVGAVYTDQAALAAVVEDLRGTPVLRADTDRAEEALEAIAWVEDARVTTDFPHGATIEIRERSPVATFEGPDGAFRVIDTHGRVLDVLAGQPVEYVLLVSADAPDVTIGAFAPQGFGAAASLVQALTPELRARAQSVSVTADGSDLRLMLTDGIEVRFGAARDLVVKLVRLQTRLDELEGGPMSYVDVSTNEVTTG